MGDYPPFAAEAALSSEFCRRLLVFYCPPLQVCISCWAFSPVLCLCQGRKIISNPSGGLCTPAPVVTALCNTSQLLCRTLHACSGGCCSPQHLPAAPGPAFTPNRLDLDLDLRFRSRSEIQIFEFPPLPIS